MKIATFNINNISTSDTRRICCVDRQRANFAAIAKSLGANLRKMNAAVAPANASCVSGLTAAIKEAKC
jgi:hypothetical protein